MVLNTYCRGSVMFRFAAVSAVACAVVINAGCLSTQSPGNIRLNCRLLVTPENEVVVISSVKDTIRGLPNGEHSRTPVPSHIAIESPTRLIVGKTRGANHFADIAQVGDGHEIVIYNLTLPSSPKRSWAWPVPRGKLVLCVAVASEGDRLIVGTRKGSLDETWIVKSDGTNGILATSNILSPLSLEWFSFNGKAFVAVNYEAGPMEMFSGDAPHNGVAIADTEQWGHMIGNVADKYLLHAGILFGHGPNAVAALQVEQVSTTGCIRRKEVLLGRWTPQQAVGIATANEMTVVCRCLDNDRQSAVFIGVADLVGEEWEHMNLERWEWYQWEPGLDVHDVALVDHRAYALATVDEELGVFSCDTSRAALPKNPQLKVYTPNE